MYPELMQTSEIFWSRFASERYSKDTTDSLFWFGTTDEEVSLKELGVKLTFSAMNLNEPETERKYSSVKLINEVNLINSVQSFLTYRW